MVGLWLIDDLMKTDGPTLAGALVDI